MKTHLIILPALFGTLLFSCDRKEKDSYTEAMQEQVAEKGSSDGEDENTEMEDNQPFGSFELGDTLQLPDPLMLILKKDPLTSPDKIRNIRKYTENGIDYYEITFDNPVKEMQLVTYDDLGRIKSPNLDKPEN